MNNFNMLSTEPKPTSTTHGSLKSLDTLTWDTGEKFEYRGTVWVQTHAANGAARVNNAFIPSSYTGKISSSENGTTFAIVAGLSKVQFQSLDLAVAGTPEYAVIAFGTSAADAQANLVKTGTTPNIISTAGIVLGSSTEVGKFFPAIGIPASATHCAVGNGVAATIVQLMVTQGN